MGEIFTPYSKTIKKLFEGSTYYQVPQYQRPYSWESEHVEELWEDLYNSYESGEAEYFLGSIILSKNNSGKYLDVIDGQQRLTTLMILFCALRDLYYNKLEDTVKKNMILGRIKDIESGNDRLKLKTQAKDQNEFEQEVLNSIKFDKKLTKSDLKENNFLNAAFIFKEKIDQIIERDPKIIEEFTEYLLEKVSVVTIECSNQSFAIKLFQVLNNRGMDLNPADLIKSYLMGELKEEDYSSFEADWNNFENKAKDLEENLTRLFTYYEYYLLASNPKKEIYEELERKFKHMGPKEIIHEFKRIVKIFDEIKNKNSKDLFGLQYLRHDVYWKSILISAKLKEWDKDDFDKLVHSLKRFYYLYWIGNYTTTKIKQTSFNIISWIKKGENVEFIYKELDKKINDDKVILEVKKSLKNNAYNTPWFKPLLMLIEYRQIDDSNLRLFDLDKTVHLEHILPQAYKKVDYWTERFSNEEGDKLVNTIGNLTLLSGRKNIEASNRPFPDKLKTYAGIHKKEGITGFLVTQRIYNNCKEKEEWTKEKINERRSWILNEVEELLDVDFDQEIEEIEEKIIKESGEDLFKLLQEKVIEFSPDVNIEEKKHYIAFKISQNNFLAIKKQMFRLKLYLGGENLNDPKKLISDVSNIGHHGTGKNLVIFDNKDKLDDILGLIKQSYEEVKKNGILQKDSYQDMGEDYVKSKMDEETYKLLQELRKQLGEITNFEEEIKKYYLGFRNSDYYFGAARWRQKYLRFVINGFIKGDLVEDNNLEYDPGSKELIISIHSKEDIKKYLNLIKYSDRFKESK